MQFLADLPPAKLNIALWGPSGAGKTYTALAIAHALGPRVAVVDTEHGSSRLYAARFPADTLLLTPPFAPARFLEAIDAAERAYDVLVVDSLSPEWAGPGGCLEQVAALRKAGKKPHQAWDAVTAQHDALLDRINHTRLSIIVTLREKERLQLDGADTQTSPPTPIMRKRFEYEYDVVLHLDQAHRARVDKSRLAALPPGHTVPADRSLLAVLQTALTNDKGGTARAAGAGPS